MRIFQDITLGQYMPGESFLHKLDPRTKIISLLFFIVTIFSTADLTALLLIFIFILLSIRLSSFSVFFILKGVSLFFWLFAFTAIFHLFFTPGDSIYPFPVWGINITNQGLHQGIIIFSQLLLVILTANIFTLTTSPMEMTMGIERMLRPLNKVGIKTEEVSLMISLSMRFIPILKEEAFKIVSSQRARGVDFTNGTIVIRARNIVSVIGPLFTNIFTRSDTLVIAMMSRGFGQRDERGSLKKLAVKKSDLLALSASIALLSMILLKY